MFVTLDVSQFEILPIFHDSELYPEEPNRFTILVTLEVFQFDKFPTDQFFENFPDE